MSTPTQRTIALLRKSGWTVAIVERWVPHARKKIDLFGLIDILAIRPGQVMGVQTTSGSNHAAHVSKALAEPRLKRWLEAGGRFVIWSWSKKGARGKRKLWTVRKQEIKLNELALPNDQEAGG